MNRNKEIRPGQKFCYVCQDFRPIGEFWKCSSKADGLDTRCKECAAKNGKKWWKENFERIRDHKNEQRRIWRKNNPEREAETRRLWREKNQDKRRKYAKEGRQRQSTQPWEFKAARNCNKRARAKDVPYGMKAPDLYDPSTGALPIVCPIFPNIMLDYSHGPDMRRWPSVDRKVPELGYTTGNVWVISMAANTWKSNGSNPAERKRITALMAGKPKPMKINNSQGLLF